MEKLLIIDAMPQVWRAAMAGSVDDDPVAATERMFTRIREEHEADRVVAALDSPGPTWRHLAYPPYKGQRPETPSAVRVASRELKVILSKLRISFYHLQMAEADDIAASLVMHSMDSIVVTPDKDLLPLVGLNGCRIYDDRYKVWKDDQWCQQRFGVDCHQMADFLALAGDKADNIPGVKGVGEKKAARLLARYGGSIESMYKELSGMDEFADGAPPQIRLLKEDEFKVRLYKQLTTLTSHLLF
tara:strand:- start:484 stop:1215 length:732 start_codon:yes stop_codon:yes gene_type:complete